MRPTPMSFHPVDFSLTTSLFTNTITNAITITTTTTTTITTTSARLMKWSNLKEHPKYELTVLVLFVFGCYALAENISWEGGSMR